MGGGPLLLIVTASVLLPMMPFTTLIEALLFTYVLGVGKFQVVMWAIGKETLKMSLFLGIAVPIALALGSMVGLLLPAPLSDIVLAMGTWVTDNSAFGQWAARWALILFLVVVAQLAGSKARRFSRSVLAGGNLEDQFGGAVAILSLSAGLTVAVSWLMWWRELIQVRW